MLSLEIEEDRSDYDRNNTSNNIEPNWRLFNSSISLWLERWFLSTNAKDIGVLYLIFSLFSGLLGTAFSVLIRMELSGPGVQYIADNQLYNSIITAHAILMIFFMVNIYPYMLNMKLQLPFNISKVNLNNNDIVITGDDNNFDSNNNNSGNNNNGNKNSKYKYVKVLVDDPFNNRDIILRVSKNQKGVYLWESLDGKHIYVGHSINLYNRISSYFMPSILRTKARRVLRYFNKYGFNNIRLIIYIMDENTSLEQVVELEQNFIDSIKPNLNVDLIASSSGHHEPMNQEIRERLRKQRGTPVYIYRADDFTLLYIFESKQHMYNSINIHHNTLNSCLNLGTLYLDTFFFSLDLIEESTNSDILTLDEIKFLINNKRDLYKIKKHPSAQTILAEFKDDSRKNKVFYSLSSLAKHLKGDRQVIREYLKGKSGYYRGKWKFYLK